MFVTVGIILSCIVVWAFPERHLKLALFISAVIFGIIGFSMQTQNHYDLVFHYNLYESLYGVSFFDLSQNYYYNEFPGYVIYLYLLSFLKDPHWLSAISAFIGYGLCFASLYKITKYYSLEKKDYLLSFFYICAMLPFLDFAAGIRGAISYSLCIFCFVTESMNEKKRIFCWAGYLYAISVHNSAVILLAIRILMLIKNNFWRVSISILLVASGLFSETISSILGFLYARTGLRLFQNLSDSFFSYVVSESHDLYEYGVILVRLAGLILVLVMNFASRKVVKEENRKFFDRIGYFNVLCSFFTLGFIFQYDIFCRISLISTMTMPAFIPVIKDEKEISVLRAGIFLLAIFVLFYYTKIYYGKFEYSLFAMG